MNGISIPEKKKKNRKHETEFRVVSTHAVRIRHRLNLNWSNN